MRAATAPSGGAGHPYLKASFQIGSVKGPTSYDQTTVVFHPDDIPAAKVQNKKDVKTWKKERSKGLGTSARWDMTVENPDPVSRHHHRHRRRRRRRRRHAATPRPPTRRRRHARRRLPLS